MYQNLQNHFELMGGLVKLFGPPLEYGGLEESKALGPHPWDPDRPFDFIKLILLWDKVSSIQMQQWL